MQAGQFHIEQAMSLEQLQELDEQQLLAALIAVDAPLQNLPAVHLNDQQAASTRQGQTLNLAENLLGMVRMYHAAVFLGLGEMRLDGKLAPKKLFNLND